MNDAEVAAVGLEGKVNVGHAGLDDETVTGRAQMHDGLAWFLEAVLVVDTDFGLTVVDPDYRHEGQAVRLVIHFADHFLEIVREFVLEPERVHHPACASAEQ